MTNLYHEAVFPFVIVMSVIVKAEHSVVKPVVPKFCLRLCNETARCRIFVYMASYLSCHLISEKEIQQSLEDVERMHAENNLTCPNDVRATKRKNLQLNRPSRATKKGPKKKKDQCGRKHCEPPDKLKKQNERSRCVLFRQENMTFHSDQESKIVHLPLMVKQGMKLRVCGEYMKGEVDTQTSFTRDGGRKETTNPFTWFHVFMEWIKMSIVCYDGFTKYTFDGEFPITDPSHFTLELELMPNSTKIYVEKVLVRTARPFREIPELYINRYKKVHFLEVQKTGKGCDEKGRDNG